MEDIFCLYIKKFLILLDRVDYRYRHCVIFFEHKGYRPPCSPESEGVPTPIVALNSPGEILHFRLLQDFFNNHC